MTFLPLKDEFFNDIHEFIEYLEGLQIEFSIPSNLQIVATLSNFPSIDEFNDSLVKRGFVIEKDFGKLLYISKLAHEKKIFYYAFFDDRNNVPLFLTIARKTDDIPDTLLDYVKKSKDISNLWIAPKAMKEIKDDLIERYPDLLITYFSAKRSPFTDIPAEYRPEVERGIQYRGDDGKATLNEMEFYYGVLPKILELKLPNGVAFRIDNKGIITLKQGDFANIFKIIENMIKKLIIIRDKIGVSGYNIHRVGVNKQFKNIVQTPWSISMPSGMGYDDVNFFRKAIESEDWEFSILDHVLLNGSVFFSARMIDNNNSAIFDITTTGSKIDIYPVEKADIGTSLKFYEFIVENMDPHALVR
jgi:hypothetical protein